MATAEAVDVAARAGAEEKAIRARIVKKWQRRNTHALAQEQNRAVREMVGLLPKEDKDGEDSSKKEHIWLDPYCVFDQYFRKKDVNGVGKDKGSWRWYSPP
ncbi:Pyrophosphate-energized vacuolar membrane proton pump [Hordeum vulgare]|nr:Pyrophosphate-energized vacuolar membrane proton pump [Hordeum vulgare]